MYVCTTGGSGRRQIGGAERILMDLIPAMAAKGVEVLALTPDDQLGAKLRAAGVPWVDLGARRRVDFAYAREIRHAAAAFRPDVVCVHLLSAAMHARAAMALGNPRPPLVITLHSSLWQHRDVAKSAKDKALVQSNILVDGLLSKLRPHATVAVSEFEAHELRKRGGRKDVHIIPNSLPLSWPDLPFALPLPRKAGPARVGYLGRLELEKGADVVHSVAALLPDMTFRIAGTGRVTPKPGPNVEMLGHIDSWKFLQEIDCLLVPSRVEAFGLSALEALSVGVPVVHTGAGGLAEVTRHAEGRLAFTSDLSPERLAARTVEAASVGDSAERREIAEWYTREFAFGAFVDRWHELYRSLANATE